MKKLLLLMISFLGYSSVTMAQAAETQESAAKLEAEQAAQQPLPAKYGKVKVANNQQSNKAKAEAASKADNAPKPFAETKHVRKAAASTKKTPSPNIAPSFTPNN